MYNSLKEMIRALFGENTDIIRKTPVYGGDINQAYLLDLSGSRQVFMKSNSLRNLDFFRAESDGLHAIRQTGAIRTPELFGFGKDEEENCSFLLMEYGISSNRRKDYWETFGHRLAAMHLARLSWADRWGEESHGAAGDKCYGFPEDNYIGASPQINDCRTSWITFFRECRLEPQIKMADYYLDPEKRKKLIHFLDRLDNYLTEPDRPSLLHGDLWSGNVLCGSDGEAWLIDPAVYAGHYEGDIAMTQLFGGFPAEFYGAYNEVLSLDNGYSSRRDIYNLYHLLNHLNLFGPGYLGSVMGIVTRFV